MHRHWDAVHKDLHTNGKVREVKELKKGVKHSRSGSVKDTDEKARMVDGRLVGSDTEDEELEVDTKPTTEKGASERELQIARWAVRRWMNNAGVQRGSVGMVDHHDDEYMPLWTKGIAPK